MPRKVKILPSNHEFLVQDDETVLDAALREGFLLPYGCRNGACGSCKARVVEGEVDYGGDRPQALSDLELHAGYALLCRALPRTDLEIECREINAARDIPVKILPCRVQKMERLAPDVMMVKLKLPAAERMQFLAGQYIEFILKDLGRRSFSIANPPHDDGYIDLHIRNYGGAFSTYVFTRMKEKEILRFEGPLGTFFLREDSGKPIVLVASGTGFAPIKAIIEHAIHHGVKRPITLYWGGRRPPDLYLSGLAMQWEREHDIRYVPVLSDAAPEDGWAGRTGFVHAAVVADFPDLSGYQVYACGNPLMVEAARRELTGACRLPDADFYCDAFTPAAP